MSVQILAPFPDAEMGGRCHARAPVGTPFRGDTGSLSSKHINSAARRPPASLMWPVFAFDCDRLAAQTAPGKPVYRLWLSPRPSLTWRLTPPHPSPTWWFHVRQGSQAPRGALAYQSWASSQPPILNSSPFTCLGDTPLPGRPSGRLPPPMLGDGWPPALLPAGPPLSESLPVCLC